MRTQSFFSLLVLPILVAVVGCNGDDPSNNNTGGGNTGGQGGGSNGVGDLVLDKAFGDDGITRATRPFSTDYINAAAWMPDGAILQGGSTGDRFDFHPDALLARFTASGQPDTTFGNGGFVTMAMGDGATIFAVEGLPNGGAIIAGTFYRYSTAYAFLARVDAKGTLDPSFGTNGSTRVEIDFSERYARIARADSGHIALLVAEYSSDNVWLMRFDANGNLDTAFGDAGHVNLGGDAGRDVLVAPDGSYLALTIDSSTDWLHHIDANGNVDSSFGTGGRVALPSEPFDVERHESGKILVGGGSNNGWIMQFDSAGVPDPSFGTNGSINPLLDDEVTTVKWLPNGDFLAITSIVNDPPALSYRKASRFAPDGTPVMWNADFQSPLSKTLSGSGVTDVLQKGGNIYFVGSKRGVAASDHREAMTVVVHDDATLDDTFGTAGLAMRGSNAPPEVLWGMTLRSDDSVIAMGTAGTDGMFARFADGKHDTTWGTDGFANIKTFSANGVTVDAKDRILITTLGLNLGRYLPTGESDTSFGMMGQATLGPGGGLVADIALDSKQRIIVCGESSTDGAFVARILDDGTPDPAFGMAGIAQSAAGLAMAGAPSCVVGSDDKVAFAAIGWGAKETFFARVNEDGTTDTSFGTAGAPTVVGQQIRAFRMIPRKSGGYLAVGSDWWCATKAACTTIVVALRADGTLDAGFGEGGLARIEEASYYQAWQGLAELPDGSVVVAGAIQEDVTEKLAVWVLRPDGTMDANAAPFILPGKGRATSALVDDKGVIIGGWAYHPKTGSDMVLLRFSF